MSIEKVKDLKSIIAREETDITDFDISRIIDETNNNSIGSELTLRESIKYLELIASDLEKRFGDYEIAKVLQEIANLIQYKTQQKEVEVCKNCKYIRTTYAPTCSLGVVSQGLFGNGIVTLDFGCNKFEKKRNV